MRGGHCRLMAVSGMAQLDRRSEIAQAIESALHESVLRKSADARPTLSHAKPHATVAPPKPPQPP